MARDQLELRAHRPTTPVDLNDPSRFGQFIETTKDAFVEELRLFFGAQQQAERLQEAPTIEKYAFSFTGSDALETTMQIVQEFIDEPERLPHVAVLAASGKSRRLTVGRPFIAHTQAPPRVVTTNQEPYALAEAQPQISTVTVDAVAVQTYTITLNSVDFDYTADGSETVEVIAERLRSALVNNGANAIVVVTISGNVITLTGVDDGVAFTLGVNANLTDATPQAAGAASTTDQIVFRTTPNKAGDPVITTIPFRPGDFPTATPITAATAAEIARIFNNRALYARARVIDQGGTPGLQFENGGPRGGAPNIPHNEIEILPESSANLVSALGLANTGSAAVGDTIAAPAPGSSTATLTIAGATFTAADVGRFVTIAGATSAANNGRFLVTAVPGATQVEFTNADAVSEAFETGTYFIGFRDDTRNPARPKMNRYHGAWDLRVHIEVITEDPNARRELLDLVMSFLSFYAEDRFFTFYGRSVFEEGLVDADGQPLLEEEHYQISVHSDVTDGGDSDIPRPDDNKDKIFVSRVEAPVTTFWYIDRPVLVQSGPSTGESFTLENENLSLDGTLPFKN